MFVIEIMKCKARGSALLRIQARNKDANNLSTCSSIL